MGCAPAETAHSKHTMKGMSDILRTIRTERNRSDAEMGRTEYTNEEYSEIFSYRKGGRKYVMKREQDIARYYRKAKKMTVYWDDDEEVTEEDDSDME